MGIISDSATSSATVELVVFNLCFLDVDNTA
eukprot:CAMPEP_0202460808 /NCGR_PEP_ID=MMETSP1360-20130828/46026_1 /ASSEMBLY_ACC=CAM_ASM_000848 /TAXON_ID=515479 /ORGANISM="Licmophora paradoxa, Strain CCMP2313" /LENGTH=30 /DNA_ID= /DNA_START= /DNA_END= /DNA_ORIENTATION=